MSRVLPILFNGDMVRAILDGRKTVTRRCVKFLNGKNPNWTGYVKDGLMLYNGTNEPCIKLCQYHPGDIMYVRETWCKGKIDFGEEPDGREVLYVSQCQAEEDYIHKEYVLRNGIGIDDVIWKPSIHMPKEAARIWLKVKDVRVERLQEITEDGIRREGVAVDSKDCAGKFDYVSELFFLFQKLWNSTIKKSDLDLYGWDASPWVWVIEFERCENPEGW